MKIGMLWFDNDTKKPFAEKCNKAIEYYQNKYNKIPNLIVVSPDTAISEIENVKVQLSKSIMPNHFWVGRE